MYLSLHAIQVSDSQRQMYYKELQSVDTASIQRVGQELYFADQQYQQSRGWFSCDSFCQQHKQRAEQLLREYNALRAEEERAMSSAKSKLGLFSEYGVEETRDLFWERFGQGKNFATRQTKWDALFYGISAMGRDESLVAYIFRLVLSFLFNFTIGVVGAVLVFIGNSVSLVRSYQVSFAEGLVFFGLASLAAVSFALTWLIGLYAVTAGTVFVGAKLVSANMRIEDGSGGQGPRRRVHYS